MGSETFDLVISEYLLPGMLGDEVFRRIRADAPSRTVPILMLTQMAEPAKLQEAITAGANDYVLKPFDPIELTARARAAIRRSQN
jgi:DNA-binding response OmpR family regulator